MAAEAVTAAAVTDSRRKLLVAATTDSGRKSLTFLPKKDKITVYDFARKKGYDLRLQTILSGGRSDGKIRV